MDILMVAAELSPWVESGAPPSSTAETVASLSKAVRQLGHEVTLALPRFRQFEEDGLLLARRLTPLTLEGGGEATVFDGQLSSGVKLVLFDGPSLFDRDGVYGDDKGLYSDNAERFGLFCRATETLVRQRAEQGHGFDVVHAFDWPSAALPALLKRAPKAAGCVLSVADATTDLPLTAHTRAQLGLTDNSHDSVLAAGIVAADVVTTTSPSYAEELLEAGSAHAALFEGAGDRLVGILGGVDYALCNPATDARIASRYDAEDASNKGNCRTALLRELELELDLERPIVLVTGAITAAGGFDVLADALPKILRNDLTLVILGRGGDDELVARFNEARDEYRDGGNFAFLERSSETAVHAGFAGADVVVVPAAQEPADSAYLWGMRYGAIPVAHALRRARDTLVDCDAQLRTGTGFLYEPSTPQALSAAVARAVAAFRSGNWGQLRRRAMRADLGWDRPARRFLQVYRQAL